MSLRTVKQAGGGDFTTIQAALDDLYAVVGSATFTETHTIEIYNGDYKETFTPHQDLDPTATYRLVITAATSNSPSVNGENTRTYGAWIYSVGYVTIKGLEFKNFNSANCIFLHSGCPYTIIDTCVFHDATLGYGVSVGGSSSYVKIYNSTFYSLWAGISFNNETYCEAYDNTFYSIVGAAINTGSYNIIHDNLIYSTGTAIGIFQETNCQVYDNEIYSVAYGISSYGYGGANYSDIHDNLIYTFTGSGIILGGSNMKIYNNYLYGTSNEGMSLTGDTNSIYNNLIRDCGYIALSISSASGNKIYNNTITGVGWCVALTGLTGNNYLKNNILIETGGYACIFTVPGDVAYIISDQNCLYNPSGYVAWIWSATPCATLAIWQSNSGEDTNSISTNPLLVDRTGTLDTDFKLTLSSPCIGVGLSYSGDFTTDYFGTTRNGFDYFIPNTFQRTKWELAYTNNHTHSNKTTLDLITEAFTTALKSAYDAAVTASHARSHTLLSGSDHSDASNYIDQAVKMASDVFFNSVRADDIKVFNSVAVIMGHITYQNATPNYFKFDSKIKVEGAIWGTTDMFVYDTSGSGAWLFQVDSSASLRVTVRGNLGVTDTAAAWNMYLDFTNKRVGFGTLPNNYDFQIARQIGGIRVSSADYIEWHLNNLEPTADWFFRVDGTNNDDGYLKLYLNALKVFESDMSGNAYFPVTLKAGKFDSLGEINAVQPGAHAYRSSAQTISNTTWTKVELNAETFDVIGEFDSATNYRYTATKAGYYTVHGAVRSNSIATGYIACLIMKNGAPYPSSGVTVCGDWSNAAGGTVIGASASCVVYLAANDYLQLYIYQNSGGNIDTSTGTEAVYLSVMKIA